MTTDANVASDADALQDGRPSPDGHEPSTDDLAKLKELIDKAADERHSKLDRAKAAAERKAEMAQKSLEQVKSQLDKVIKERDEEMLRQAQDDPEKLTAYQLKVKMRESEAEIQRLKQELEEKQELVSQSQKVTTEKLAERIADKYGVDQSSLLALTDGTEEKMTKLAETLAKVAAPKKAGPDVVPDSNINLGVAAPSPEQLQSWDTETYIQKRAELFKAFGLEPPPL